MGTKTRHEQSHPFSKLSASCADSRFWCPELAPTLARKCWTPLYKHTEDFGSMEGAWTCKALPSRWIDNAHGLRVLFSR